jgi:hypothetical protein
LSRSNSSSGAASARSQSTRRLYIEQASQRYTMVTSKLRVLTRNHDCLVHRRQEYSDRHWYDLFAVQTGDISLCRPEVYQTKLTMLAKVFAVISCPCEFLARPSSAASPFAADDIGRIAVSSGAPSTLPWFVAGALFNSGSRSLASDIAQTR